MKKILIGLSLLSLVVYAIYRIFSLTKKKPVVDIKLQTQGINEVYQKIKNVPVNVSASTLAVSDFKSPESVNLLPKSIIDNAPVSKFLKPFLVDTDPSSNINVNTPKQVYTSASQLPDVVAYKKIGSNSKIIVPVFKPMPILKPQPKVLVSKLNSKEFVQ